MIVPKQQPSHDEAPMPLDWEALYWELMPRIFNFFRYRLGDDEISQDLTSSTFTKAWKARHQYRHDLGAFEAWLFTIARNVANDYLRQSQRRKEVPLEDIWAMQSEMNVEGEAQKRREFALLHALLKTLPMREQELIALKYGANMNNRAIAKALGLSESNVGTILHRAVLKLRRHWDKEESHE
jgi:RNA polymerase sigma-70 factor (ECF subfamily)